MALFGTDMTTVTTPDGRRITVPAQLAQAFPALQPVPPEVAQPPAIPVAPPPPTFTPQDQADLAKLNPPPDASAAPVTAPSQVPPAGPGGPRGPVATPAQETDAGPPNTPPPMTNDRLAQIGTAGAYNEQVKAQQEERAAVERQGEALADQATKIGAEMEAANEHARQLLVERERVAQENAAALQAEEDSYRRNAKAIADTKVDRSVDHPVLAALSAALIGIGQSMGGQPIDAMGAVYKAIDRKVAAQMQDLDKRRGDLALQRDAIGMQREAGRDRLREMDTLRLAYIEQAKRQLDTIEQQTKSDVIRASTGLLRAQLDQKSAETLGAAVDRVQQRREAEAARRQQMQMHQQSLGMQYQIHRETMAERAQEKLDERAAQVLAIQAKKGEERAKDVRERGVWNPGTGEFMITPEGQQKLKQADAAEAAARTAKDPQVAAERRAYATALRESAKTDDIELAPDPERSRKAAEANGASHAMYQKLASAKEMLSGDPSAWDREKWAAIKTELGAIANEYAGTIGERVSPKAMEAFVDHIAGFDADDVFSRLASKGKALAAVDQLEKFVKTNTDARLKSLGIRSGWVPSAPNETGAEQTFRGKTSQEIGAAAEPGLAGKAATGLKEAGKAILNPLDAAAPGSNIGRRDRSTEAENAAIGSSNYGLDPKDETAARSLIAQANSAGDAQRRQIVDTLAQPIIRDNRPGLSGGVMGVLRDNDPRLMAEVIARVQAENPKLAAQMIQIEQMRGQLPGRNLPPLPRSK